LRRPDNAKRPKRERLTYQRIFGELTLAGYAGGYDAVRRYARPGLFARAPSRDIANIRPGRGLPVRDWSHEHVLLAGAAVTLKVAQTRLCYSRMPFARAYPRETHEKRKETSKCRSSTSATSNRP
jgi:hypothetical protein